MKKIFAVIAVLLCAVFGCTKPSVEEIPMPTVLDYTFGDARHDVVSDVQERYKYNIGYGEDGSISFDNPVFKGVQFNSVLLSFDDDKLNAANFTYNAKNLEDANIFYKEVERILESEYGKGVPAKKIHETTIKELFFGKHCQGDVCACDLFLAEHEGNYYVVVYYVPVKFNASTANTASVAKGKLTEVLGVMMGEDADEVYKSLLRRYGFQRVMLTDNGQIQVNDPVLDGITYEAAFFSIQKNKNVVNSVELFKSTYNATTAKIYHEQVNDKQVELYGEGKEISTTKTGVIQRTAYGKHYNQNKHSHFVELFYDDVAGYMICLEYEKIFF